VKKRIDWPAAKTRALQLVTVVRSRLQHFGVANQHIRAAARFENCPPRVVLEFERRPGRDGRRSELYDGGHPRLAVMPDDDKRTCAAFVAEIAEALELRPWMEWDGDRRLRYTLKPDYQEFANDD
jgi:hypothetical protein